MPKNIILQIRVTRDQLDRIKLNAQAKGFNGVAGYIRYTCLEYNQHAEAKIIENNKILKEIIGIIKQK